MKDGNIPTVLIVEDDVGVAHLEQRRLERAGYDVVTAATPDEALQRLAESKVALVLLDYRLPGYMDGLAFYSHIKDAGYDVPVILVTGFGNEAAVIRALRLGVRDFVTKSVEYLDYLPEAIGRVLKQVHTENQLAESEARLTAVIDSAMDAILTVEADGRISLFNRAAEQIFRCRAAQGVGQPITCFMPKVPLEATEAKLGPDPQAAEKTFSVSLRSQTLGRRADGEEFPLEASVTRVDVAGRKFYTLMVRDITERKRAEEVLRESEERFQTFMDNSPTLAFVKDEEGRYVYVNSPVERFLGWRPSELLMKTDDEIWPGETARQLRENDLQAFSTGKLVEVTEAIPKADGTLSHWLVFKFPFQNRSGKRFLGGVAIDVTGYKRLEAQYRQAQKMEAIGRLAGGVAHDFNNLLTVIKGYSDLLLKNLNSDSPLREPISEISQAGDRAAKLTRQLLAFSRQQLLAPQVLDLNALVSETETMLRRVIGEDIDLAASLDPGLGNVKADPGQLEQVIVNLVVNARDAMPTGGHLTLETRNVVLDEGYAKDHAEVRPGRYVMLAISDTGIGMDEATRAQVFEPFFTTKEAGKGTGLGLAMVYGIVRQSDGHIEVYSEPGHGTTFKIYLPRVDQPVKASKSAPGQLKVAGGTETVLLTEDEDGVRVIARITLQSLGYKVLEARNGAEAIRVCRQHEAPIHALVTDVVMPKMSGRELADHLLLARPDLKVLYLSGYTDDAILRHGVLETGVAFLQKPFTPSTLARKVREVLDS